MKLKDITKIISITLFFFIIISSVYAIDDNTTSDTLELPNNEESINVPILENDNDQYVLEKMDGNYNTIQQKSLEYNNTISVTSDSPTLSYSDNSVEINHDGTYTITYKQGSITDSTTFTLNELEKTKIGEDLRRDNFTIKYYKSSHEESYSVYRHSMLEGSFDVDSVNKLAKGNTISENRPSNSYVFNPNLWINCNSNYYSITCNGYTGKYSAADFEDFINGKTNYIHSDTGKTKTTKDAQYKVKWTKKWFYVGEVVLKKKVRYVNGLKIVKKNNINYLTIGKVKQEYTKVVKVVDKYKKVNKNLLKKGWEYDGYIHKKIKYKNGKTIIKYYYKYRKSYEVFKGYKYYKNDCSMTLEQGSNGKKAVSIWYFDKANWNDYKEISKTTFNYSI